MHRWPFEAAHALGAVPLLVLIGRRRDAAFWWIAGGYFVSFLADTASHWTGHPLVSSTYPLLQAGLIAAALLADADLTLYVLLLAWAATTALGFQGVTGLDILLHTVAWLPLVAFGWRTPFRSALLVSFGLGWLCWLAYTGWPGWTTWLLFQGTRVAGTGLFCRAAIRAARLHLILLRRAA